MSGMVVTWRCCGVLQLGRVGYQGSKWWAVGCQWWLKNAKANENNNMATSWWMYVWLPTKKNSCSWLIKKLMTTKNNFCTQLAHQKNTWRPKKFASSQLAPDKNCRLPEERNSRSQAPIKSFSYSALNIWIRCQTGAIAILGSRNRAPVLPRWQIINF